MKHYKRSNTYKASNVEFNLENKESTSYNWWVFTKVINGKLIFNNYNYSPTTNKHQSKVRSLLGDLDIKIDITIHTRRSLDQIDCLESAIKNYEEQIGELETLINKPRTRKSTNEKRRLEIEELKLKIGRVKSIN